MGLHYRKSIKLLPGIRLELNSRGRTSLVTRIKCLHLRLNTRGVHGRIYFSKLGLSYRFDLPQRKRKRQSRRRF